MSSVQRVALGMSILGSAAFLMCSAIGHAQTADAISDGPSTESQKSEDAIAQAAEAPAETGVADIDVTANRRAENLQRVPISIKTTGGKRTSLPARISTNFTTPDFREIEVGGWSKHDLHAPRLL